MMLVNRAAEGDDEEDRGMPGEALSSYDEMGMPSQSEIVRALLDSIETGSQAPPRQSAPLRRDDERRCV
jgi:hypothetical protein